MFLKKHYQAYLPDADIAIVPNGIDLEVYQKNAVPLQKSDLGITPEKKRFSLQAVYHRIRE
ncbi:hypothetical protein ACMUSW_004160 [Salmonella enterica subsp. enterica serovar Meleagridis]|uniref:GlcNAc transferase n=2 Tax=Salmonella enterica I TaxID=59201 RepID=A0A379VQF7_SALET|nr:lipopolysaccharide 1,2-N-acetylglucosaminetransferase [Salmonella enterica]ESG25738.1 lipopolysaccharide 1,2-N-acetylglucosaminetransferase [Salmonella enterica subsp. enterica serovar Meleagridis str. 0047]ESJ50780.1 lipopolysaccharide 1,2-N-acetylglucosaminetransferase [Salmonella enterica subsp. enterica serovar Cubana str. CFSAN001083]ETA87290.1 hypothetical protein A628_02589 [Salmonella enterica subsp. enterica serovar Cubana str. 76814]PQB14756.1 Lipopolysaccharide 1,2-N-acetylglucosa